MPLHSIASYARAVRPGLPAGVFAPSRWPLVSFAFHLCLIAAAMVGVGTGRVPWPAALLLVPVVGFSFGVLSFVAHETLHGAVVRDMRLRTAIGWLGFLPFVLSPRLWVFWHNRVHHGHTNQPSQDPDTYPTLAEYEQSSAVRSSVDLFALGGRRWRGAFSLVVGFSVQSASVLAQARRWGMSPREHRLALAETAVGVALWVGLAALIGPLAFLLVFALPLLVANVVVMAHILTNHNLSPHTDSNDPLLNSLSVTLPPVLERLTLRFGYHVEHHLFPAMSSQHAPAVRALLVAHWPERYQSMPLGQALRELHRTARVYKDSDTLVDPTTGREWPTLQPGVPLPPPSDPALGLASVVPAT
ncbi:MAG: acyl-CoA desaturase [Myxococcales bacterium]|nr:MAG: acyl-CoA desaturase [Myxococcales bacterium]